MFNDDISSPERGIFHYPSEEFQRGFTSPPADHYYRAYYLAFYKNWVYALCKDGGPFQRQFLDIWRRFANKYRDVCHFGFTFITRKHCTYKAFFSLTHEGGLFIESLDEFLKSSLENLYLSGSLDSTVSVIMGDHGNRIGLVKLSYTGRIEERMPLMAIRFPTNFKTLYPREYANFLANKYKLTSNFDIHQMLKDIVLMRLGTDRNTQEPDEGRGISLFDEIPWNRSCHDAYIAENFCTCLIDRHNLTMPEEKDPQKKILRTTEKYKQAIAAWINENDLNSCIDSSDFTMGQKVQILGLNPYVRHGMRSKRNLTALEIVLNKPPKMDFLYHEFETIHNLPDGQEITLLFRIEEELKCRSSFCISPAVEDITRDYVVTDSSLKVDHLQQ
ncbi:hypothetical protein OESDEN_04552 [Oesophagostomum dentatum]|uniref:Uncharacterized protein n=1 Tax=Oesophagostomum dentatum TaxID=61180 RepID=A0A0B1TJA4_OESDE|nr:hypothetical protein OESDEN_04552 [Oesophagostomum dentatum]